MFRQNLLLSLLLVSFMLSSHADPVTEKGCIENGSDNIGQFMKVKSDGQCRQPFEVTFIAARGDDYLIYTESTSDPIDESIIQYSFSDCKLKLKVHNSNGDPWFELLDAGANSGKKIEPGFRIHLHEPMSGEDTMMVKKKQDDNIYYQMNCDLFAGIGNGKKMYFKQEIEIGDPNIALILYKVSGYFGIADVKKSDFIGNLPPQLSTTTTVSSTTSMTSSTVATTTKSVSSSTQSISGTSSSLKTSSTVATISSKTAAEEKGMKPWLIGVIVGVPVLLLIVIALIIAVICIVRRRRKKEEPQVVDVVFKTEETKTRETTLGGEVGKSKKKSKESNKSVSKSLFGSMEKA